MWKHYHLRKHHYFLTFLEVFAPIAIVFLLCQLGSKAMNESSTTVVNSTKYPALGLRIALENAQGRAIVYTPATTVVSSIVTRVANILGRFITNYSAFSSLSRVAGLLLTFKQTLDT